MPLYWQPSSRADIFRHIMLLPPLADITLMLLSMLHSASPATVAAASAPLLLRRHAVYAMLRYAIDYATLP